MVEKFDGMCSDKIIERYCDYVAIDVSRFWEVVKKFTNKDLFLVETRGRPIPKFKVGVGL